MNLFFQTTASEIWFLGCTGFIFASLVEFAFVNIIWRRRKNVELKKVNSKYIMKSTLTPRLARKEMGGLSKARSCSSLNEQSSGGVMNPSFDNYLTVHGNVSCKSKYKNCRVKIRVLKQGFTESARYLELVAWYNWFPVANSDIVAFG